MGGFGLFSARRLPGGLRQPVFGSWRLAAVTEQSAPRFLDVRPGAAFGEELSSPHYREFFCNGQRDELVDAYAVFAAGLSNGVFQRQRQSQCELAVWDFMAASSPMLPLGVSRSTLNFAAPGLK